MLKNYLKILLRGAKRNPIYMLINIVGLAVGMAVSVLILLFVQHELSYDKYHENTDNIYRISREWFNQEGETSLHLGHLAPAFSPLLLSDFSSDIKESARLFNANPQVKFEDKSFIEERYFFAEPAAFKIFTWQMVEGDPEEALSYPDGVIITESTAKKYFGDVNPMGKRLEINLANIEFTLQVRGIVKDTPDQSHFKFDFLASFDPVEEFFGGPDQILQNFGSNSFSTYVLLEDHVKADEFEKQLPAFIDRHMSASNTGVPASASTRLNLWPIADIHLYSNLDSEIEPNSSIEYVYIYLAIAFFILVIACVNFMNLSTARSAKRAMEVGLRKVMGADKKLLVKQFMGESFMLTILASIIACLLIYISLPTFANFTGKVLNFNLIDQPEYLGWIALLILVVGVFSGSYPALYLSGFQPGRVMKGTFKTNPVHERLRSALVIGQFTISIILIVSVIVVINQLDFMKNRELGFDKDDIVVLPAYSEFTANYDMMENRLLQHNGIEGVAIASRVPSGRLLDSQGTVTEVNGEMITLDVRIADIHVSHSFIDVLGIQMASGRNFDENLASDSTEAFILNETAVRAIGWATNEEAIQKPFNYGSRRGYIVGVMKDFHFESLHQPIAPIVFMIPEDRMNNVAIKIKDGYRDEVLAYLNSEWQGMRSESPFNPAFIEDRFIEQYEAEERVGKIFGFFAFLAIIISVLGLFGLASFSTEQRIKEIGIRKVMGASVMSIVTLLGKDFLKLVMVGFIISIPIAWYGMKYWLANFAYSISMNWLIFALAGLIAFVVAILTVSSHSIKAALVNPVHSIKRD